jgi:small GTP-binding protein
MMQKKICMLGAFAVGKTSLVARYVRSVFSDRYLTTVGVKVDKKIVTLEDGGETTLMLWDLYGHDDFQTVRTSYLRGAAGYLLVADGTRQQTLEVARALQQTAHEVVGNVPFVLVLNKADLESEWQVDERALLRIAEQGWPIMRTSAKTGAGVEDAFSRLARDMAIA